MNEIITLVVAFMITALMSFAAGKKTEKTKGQKELLDVVEDVRKARDNLSDRDYVDELLRKYG